MKGLIIKSPWIDYILSGEKTWEIRGSNTSIRGEIYLIKSGTGHIYGKADLINSMEISIDEYLAAYNKHRISVESLIELPYKRTYAWVLRNAELFSMPLKYKHPQGAIIWVNLK